MDDLFAKARDYVESLNISQADPLDQKVSELLNNDVLYERASQALRRRFSRGATEVEAMDRGRRKTKIKRELSGGPGNYKYFILGEDGAWSVPEERIWVVAMYALWQNSKH